MIVPVDRLLAALADAEIPARWDMTGGNVGTIHAGPRVRWTDPSDRQPVEAFAVVIGPGDYANGALATEELTVGPDYWDPTVILPGTAGSGAEDYYQDECARLDVAALRARTPDDAIDAIVVRARELVADAEYRWQDHGCDVIR